MEINDNESASTYSKREEIKLDKIKGNNWWYRFTKRCFDFLSSFILIIVISWLLLIIFFINIFATKGHPIYKDKRLGYKGKEIKVYKFRSMVYDANNIDKYFTPEQKEEWLRERKVNNDPRITKFGKFLRKTSLDELPQLFNILFGSMSVIGPRPITEKEISGAFYPSEKELYLKAKPGLTGYWQVKARSNADFESGERQRIELEYFTKRGFWYDLGLVFRTIPAVLKHKGAQ